jgi:hypothetical protein
MKKISTRLLIVLIALVTVFVILPSGSMIVAKATTYETGEIVKFGSYPQTIVTDSSVINALNSKRLTSQNTVTFNGEKYKKVYFSRYTPFVTSENSSAANSFQDDNGYFTNKVYWFKIEPIEWRVLSTGNNELFLMAENILDSRAYNREFSAAPWETCDLRLWLNNSFYNTAFSSYEKAKIKTSYVVNEDNALFGMDGGSNTNDKLFLLSKSEALNPSFGFSSISFLFNKDRQAEGTDFAKCRGLDATSKHTYNGKSEWWLRSQGPYTGYHSYVQAGGSIFFLFYNSVNFNYIGVRPVMYTTQDIFQAEKPGIATNVKAVSASPNSIKISWSGVAGASGYEVYSSSSADGQYTTISSTAKTEYLHEKLTTGQIYYYKVKAYKTEKGEQVYSGYSASANATPEPDNSLIIKKDNNSFINNAIDFFGWGEKQKYYLSDYYYKRLVANQSDSDKEKIRMEMDKPWNGACFGISTAMSLSKVGKIYIKGFDSNAVNFYKMSSPKNSTKVRDLIHYYHLSQNLPGTFYAKNAAYNPLFSNSANIEEVKTVLKTFITKAKKVDSGGNPFPIYLCGLDNKGGGFSLLNYIFNGEKEDNNKPEDAQSISLFKTYNGSLQTSNDVDYFKFKVKKDSNSTETASIAQVNFEPEKDSKTENWAVELFDSKGNNITGKANIYVSDNLKALITYVKTDEDYYIKIKCGNSWVDNKYNITVLEKEVSAHEVVGNGNENTPDGENKIQIVDPNDTGNYIYMTISSDYSSWKFEDKNGNALYEGYANTENWYGIGYSDLNSFDSIGIDRNYDNVDNNNIAVAHIGITITAAAKDSFIVTNENGKTFTFSQAGMRGNLIPSSVRFTGDASGSETSSCDVILNFPNTGKYKVTPLDGNLDISFVDNGLFASADVTGAAEVDFTAGKMIALTGDKMVYTAYISNRNSGDGSILRFKSGESNKLSLARSAKGVLVSSDNLKNIEIRSIANSANSQTTISTDKSNIFVANKIGDNSGLVEVFSSKSENGVYDQKIGETDIASAKDKQGVIGFAEAIKRLFSNPVLIIIISLALLVGIFFLLRAIILKKHGKKEKTI